MALNTLNPTETKAWKKLEEHFKSQKNVSLQDAFKNDNNRFKDFSIHWEDFLVDYSKNRVSKETLSFFEYLSF
mgnify:FL=1